MFKRYATEEEIKVYKKVELAFENTDDDEFNEILERVSNFVYNYGQKRKETYNKCRPIAKKYNVTILELETWYCIDKTINITIDNKLNYVYLWEQKNN